MVITMERWVGKIAVVTGASAGIGAAIAEMLVKEGLMVVGLARREERIKELAAKLKNEKGELYSFKADVSKEDEILSAFDWIKNNLGPIHILINNAGITQNSNLYDGNTEMWRKVMEVNVIGLCVATREAIKSMRENNVNGHIIHINSIAGHKVCDIPAMNIYAASKHAVTSLTESLRLEFNDIQLKIKISSISPGATKTEFVTANNLDTGSQQISKAHHLTIEAEDVADAVKYVLSTPPHVQVHELIIKPLNEPF